MKKSLVAAALALGLLTPACLGPDNLYRSVKNWNGDLSDQDWVNEVVFLGLWIIPVYQFSLLGDVVIFNTVSYWTGEPTIKDPGEQPAFSAKD